MFQSPPHRGTSSNLFVCAIPRLPLSQFQSPPHRGTSSNLNGASCANKNVARFQSPPHRGTSSNSPTIDDGSSDWKAFQSPPHRGTSSNDSPSGRPGLGRPVSVPSSSGNIVERTGTFVVFAILIMFQSPPHRGTSSNWSRRVKEFSLTTGFSPLLIGEHRRTPRPRRLRRRRAGFSPLLIGEHRRTPTPEEDRRGLIQRFSPLLIGEHRRTPGTSSRGRSARWFQSPPHRGTSSNSSGAVGSSSSRSAVSVPSSSRNIVEPGRARRAAPTRRAFQSPPHRGTSSNRSFPAQKSIGCAPSQDSGVRKGTIHTRAGSICEPRTHNLTICPRSNSETRRPRSGCAGK